MQMLYKSWKWNYWCSLKLQHPKYADLLSIFNYIKLNISGFGAQFRMKINTSDYSD